MASVPLKFAPPTDEGITALLIEEAPDSTGPWSQIEEVLDVGIWPDYIAEYTTDDATDVLYWFRIRWRNADGALSPYSQPVQGGTESLVAKVKDRVMQRDPTLVDAIVYQEAEAVIASHFGVENPYDPSLAAVSYRVLSGLTYLVLARSLMVRAIQVQASGSSVESFTVGLVSVRSGTGGLSIENLRKVLGELIDMANRELGISTSIVLQMEELFTTRYRSSYDHSRLIGWIGLT